jgi:hypothetical protein
MNLLSAQVESRASNSDQWAGNFGTAKVHAALVSPHAQYPISLAVLAGIDAGIDFVGRDGHDERQGWVAVADDDFALRGFLEFFNGAEPLLLCSVSAPTPS